MEIEYQCGCTAGGDNIASFCPNHNVPINTVSDKQGKCYKVLQCLYIALDGSVAHDVNYTVKAYLMELESRVRELESERDRLNNENEILQMLYLKNCDELNKLRARHAALVEAAEWSIRYMEHFLTLGGSQPVDPNDPDLIDSEPYESYMKLKAALAAEVKRG